MANGPFYAEGLYVAEVTAQALGETRTEKPQFILRFKVLGTPTDDGAYAPITHQYERTIYMVITEKTMPYVAEKLNRLGYTGRGFGPLDPDSPNHQSFVGNQVDVYCKHESDDKGGTREKWDISRGPSALKVEPLTPKKVRELDALFGKSLVYQGITPTQPPSALPLKSSAHALDGTEITDDDIPF